MTSFGNYNESTKLVSFNTNSTISYNEAISSNNVHSNEAYDLDDLVIGAIATTIEIVTAMSVIWIIGLVCLIFYVHNHIWIIGMISNLLIMIGILLPLVSIAKLGITLYKSNSKVVSKKRIEMLRRQGYNPRIVFGSYVEKENLPLQRRLVAYSVMIVFSFGLLLMSYILLNIWFQFDLISFWCAAIPLLLLVTLLILFIFITNYLSIRSCIYIVLVFLSVLSSVIRITSSIAIPWLFICCPVIYVQIAWIHSLFLFMRNKNIILSWEQNCCAFVYYLSFSFGIVAEIKVILDSSDIALVVQLLILSLIFFLIAITHTIVQELRIIRRTKGYVEPVLIHCSSEGWTSIEDLDLMNMESKSFLLGTVKRLPKLVY